jgi:hypothetical protein
MVRFPNINKLSKASQFSLLAIFVLIGAVFFTVNTSLQQQNGASHASGYDCYLFGSYSNCNYPTPTSYSYYGHPTPTPYASQYCRQVWTGWTYTIQCVTPTPVRPTPAPTAKPTVFVAPTATTAPVQSSQSVTAFVLWNANTKSQLLTMTNGMTINLAQLPTCLDISATTDPQTVGSVKIGYDSDASFENAESTPPYWLEDNETANAPVCFKFALGTHTIKATPYTKSDFSGTAGKALSITFTVVNSQTVATPIPTAMPTRVPTAIPTEVSQPTETPAPNDTVLTFTVGLHGIGTGGDSANPDSQGNMSPLHPSRTVNVDIYDVQNQLVTSEPGTITYNTSSGKLTGSVDLGAQFVTGLYTIKVKTDQYLRALVPGIQTITAGQTKTLPGVTLVAGDINNDNAINIEDYNILIGCYSDLLPATDCSDENNALADITDDGHVNQFDYNLFLRELTNIGGQ